MIKIKLNLKRRLWNTMISMDIRIHTVDVDHEVDEVTHGQIQREHRGPGPT